MLFLVFKKIFNNKWLIASLLLGMILTVAMVCSIPLFTNGILQRMLIKDLENFQETRGIYPGNYQLEVEFYQYFSNEKDRQSKTYNYFANRFENEYIKDLGVDLAAKTTILTISHLKATPSEIYGEDKADSAFLKMYALQGYKDHISIISGRLPSGEIVDDVIECLIMPTVQKKFNIILGQIYIMEDYTNRLEKTFKVKPVGIIQPSDLNDPWWVNIYTYSDGFIMDYNLLIDYFLYEKEILTKAVWEFQIDYTKIEIDQLPLIMKVINEQEEWLDQYRGTESSFRAKKIFEEYFVRTRQLKITLWVLQVPILIMLAFYIFMVAQLVVENDKNEISLLKSRGSSRSQIFSIYLLQSTLLAVTATALGPILGVLICKILGASNGFLEFVSRSALPIKMTPNAIFYSILAGLFSIIVMMIPVLSASKISIVELKQKKARKWKAPFWQKIFLDVILLGAALFGLNSYLRQGETRMIVESAGAEAPLDPFMFVILTLFILGAGLLFLRVYPYIIKLVYLLGKKIWHPVLYSSFIQVGRSSGREQFLMLFLVLTIAVGIFSANSARTINQNIEDRVYYENGCDIKLQVEWKSNEVKDYGGMGSMQEIELDKDEPVLYIEPPFEMIANLSETIAAAKVYMPDNVIIKLPEKSKKGILMAVNPDKFGEVTWKSKSFLPHHINEYLNLLTYSPNAVIVSEKIREEYGMQVGDTLSYSWGGQSSLDGIIVAFVKYWPSINPYESEKNSYFIISNLNYVQAKTVIEPYEVWFKAKQDAQTLKVYDYIKDNNINLTWIKVAKQELIKKKNDPLLQGINGAMTLGFVVTMAISIIGFIIYWILSIKSRVLQFGIFRAMGMTKINVLSMIASEQIMISIVAIAIGIIIGGLSCRLFMPLLTMVNTAAQQVPPYRIIAVKEDYIKLYSVIIIMIVSGFAVVGVIVSRIKIAQVIKLGED